ncbi:hypothetical protein [Bosea robiniae]|uniref:Uncharacterized protein n=1 Tax=Bosea robiniae TaxID=1036780 RepID=A0ABY0NFA0_9HYPH|nr:hypothetical protein [Bosea robiniae]SDF36532.1 hypothetical protein SAMN05421844_101437 [Bosea robiniae]
MDATRFTHIRGLRVGFIRLYRNDALVSGQYGAILNDCDDVEVFGLSGDAINAAFIYIDGTNDVDGINQFSGPVTNVRIYGVAGSCAGANAIAVSTTFDVGNMLIELDGITGYTTNLCRWIAGNLTGPFRLIGRVNGNATFQGMPASDLVFIDIEQGGKRRVGRPDAARFLAGLTVASAGFDLAATPAAGKFGALFVSAVMATAGAGAYGGALVLGRPGSDRRGASLVAKQGASASAVGLSVMTGVGSLAADQEYEHTCFDAGGDLEFFTAGKGPIIKTPDGTKRYRIAVDNAGALTTTLV